MARFDPVTSAPHELGVRPVITMDDYKEAHFWLTVTKREFDAWVHSEGWDLARIWQMEFVAAESKVVTVHFYKPHMNIQHRCEHSGPRGEVDLRCPHRSKVMAVEFDQPPPPGLWQYFATRTCL